MAINQLDRYPVLKNVWVQLILCIIADIIGMLTYLLPIVGEMGDIVWSPIQTLFVYSLVGMEDARDYLLVLSFSEEILPLTDFIPSCIIAWIYKWWIA